MGLIQGNPFNQGGEQVNPAAQDGVNDQDDAEAVIKRFEQGLEMLKGELGPQTSLEDATAWVEQNRDDLIAVIEQQMGAQRQQTQQQANPEQGQPQRPGADDD